MRACVGVTDNSWAAFLRARPHINEVNFWQPSAASRFSMLQPGEPFLFKTHYPQSQLIGGGFFSGPAKLTLSEAWEFFGEGNGVASLADLRTAIGRYRRQPLRDDEDPQIGCVLLRNVFFAEDEFAVDGPPDFAKNIVRYKGYDLAVSSGSYVEQAFRELLRHGMVRSATEIGDATSVAGPVFGEARLVLPRAGQQASRAIVTDAYQRHCAITGAKITPTLQAAHIRPVAEHGENRVDNGLLLRSDVHTLFDRGYLGLDGKYRLHVSPRLRGDFGNGNEFYDRQGEVIGVPERRPDRPNAEYVTWHMDTVFKAS